MPAETLESLIARKEALDVLLDNIERWAIFFAVLVGIGVCGEAIYSVRAWWNNRNLHTVQQSIDQLRQSELEFEKRKRLELAVSLLDRNFRDQSGAMLALQRFRSGMAAVFEYLNDGEPLKTAEQINFVLKSELVNWAVSGAPARNPSMADGVTIFVPFEPTDVVANEAAEVLKNQLEKSGIDARVRSSIVTPVPPKTLLIRVGPKPNPTLENALKELGTDRPVTPIEGSNLGGIRIGGNRSSFK